ncbi:MAG: hypothetical protein J0G37_13440 [Afipia sp.]|jgi:hypothetical protein|uniref:Uncharacterized protein n=1 Tax=Bradyrhizobium denitrificans TaxID=2734912 RepID=A0ABS5GAK5_9BRAD|nr:hypothetical protein [Bradyrhizobium denitrificans]MBN9582489.1 hypothetical protein [Afipia sp.]MCB1413723.1 hypothetical protein [Xanthobacteraceae bacterium]MCW5702638.1 hypothetical protein [Bradyrhizobium sp.]MBR1138362.1 hypothetical protein [Bradyrhizobium denitrificans]WIG54122.1 MAG: hypothetical protein OJF48_005046 [Afipia sp.]
MRTKEEHRLSNVNQELEMSEAAEADSMSESERLDMAVVQAIAAHDGDP